jgi:AcrR family transcriptional regulator
LNKLSKGQITRNTILEKARYIFNEKGLDITLDIIAREMGLSKGRITNHFSTKESLFQGIMESYEWQLGEYVRHFSWEEREIHLQSIAIYTSGIMDIQYENRCAISYLSMVTREKKEVFDYIQLSYKGRVAMIRQRLSGMVKAGVLEPVILQNKAFSVFQFQYTNLLTHWVVSEQHYGGDMRYPALKPVYLQGIMQCYVPYLSAEGLQQFKNLNFSKLSKMS